MFWKKNIYIGRFPKLKNIIWKSVVEYCMDCNEICSLTMKISSQNIESQNYILCEM